MNSQLSTLNSPLSKLINKGLIFFSLFYYKKLYFCILINVCKNNQHTNWKKIHSIEFTYS